MRFCLGEVPCYGSQRSKSCIFNKLMEVSHVKK
ncbi:hypothetical protein LINPERPRIM_LOCUS39199 [Linum perenne]